MRRPKLDLRQPEDFTRTTSTIATVWIGPKGALVTTPHERTRSVLRTRDFLRKLAAECNAPEQEELRAIATTLLRHFPDRMELACSARILPGVWGDPDETW